MMQKIMIRGVIGLKIRQATKDDIESILQITAISYGFDAEAARERYTKRLDIVYDEYYCTEEDGIVTAILRMIPFQQFVRSKKLSMGGIAMVASDPLYRRKGHIRELMNFSIKKMEDENFAVSCLYPFKDTFYGNFGYVNANPFVRMKFNPKFLCRWKKLPKGYSIKRVSHAEGYDTFKEIHTKKMAEIHGGVERSAKRWKEYEQGSGNVIIAYNSKNKAEGIMKIHSKGFSTGFSWCDDGKINVAGFFCLTANARRSLYNYLFKYSDQIIEISMPIYTHESELYPWLQGYYMTELQAENIWQARIVNVKETIEDMKAPVDGEITFQVTDDLCVKNNQTYQLISKNGKFSVKELGKEKANIEFTIEGLTALVYGILSTEEIEVFDWLKKITQKEKIVLDKWFPKCPPLLTEGF
ncbi:MAG: GNAT family N-acetyltransferase [Asgard group archaeon]|nr:GNAT family N-acetyltransferase [Asgard group archaeon]